MEVGELAVRKHIWRLLLMVMVMIRNRKGNMHVGKA